MLDLIFETQLIQILSQRQIGCVSFPKVVEEIFIVNQETKTVLNYYTITECPQFSVINMLEGPTASGAGKQLYTADEEFNSQEIFTQEKYFYLFYQGLRMLEYFYKLGVTHGHINATNLKIKDDYSLCLSEFSIAQFTRNYSQLSEVIQEITKNQIRGYNRDTMSLDMQ